MIDISIVLSFLVKNGKGGFAIAFALFDIFLPLAPLYLHLLSPQILSATN